MVVLLSLVLSHENAFAFSKTGESEQETLSPVAFFDCMRSRRRLRGVGGWVGREMNEHQAFQSVGKRRGPMLM